MAVTFSSSKAAWRNVFAAQHFVGAGFVVPVDSDIHAVVQLAPTMIRTWKKICPGKMR